QLSVSRSVFPQIIGTVVFVSAVGLASGQQRDPSAIAFLNQAVNAAGTGGAISAVQDFTAQGSITHYWGENPEQGQLTVKSRGSSQFRIDSIIPEGTWSFIANNGNGEEALSFLKTSRSPKTR